MKNSPQKLLSVSSLLILVMACNAEGRGTPSVANFDGATRTDALARTDIPVVPCGDGEPPTALEQTLLDLPANSWFEVPNSHLNDVCPPTRDFGRCSSIVDAWSGGAYDSVRRQMIVWGGGHADYSGNELYAFDLRTGTWSRLTEPSVLPAGVAIDDFYNRDPLPDGQPVSRHTYDGVEFLDDLGLLWAQAGSRARSGPPTPVTWLYDANTGWAQRSDGPLQHSHAAAYDVASQQVFVHIPERLHVYDVATDTWAAVPGFGNLPYWPRYAFTGDKTAAIDSRRRLFWVVGGDAFQYPGSEPLNKHGNVMVWDIKAGKAVTDEWVTTGGGTYTNADFTSEYPEQRFESGGGDVYNTQAPGFDYDSATDSLVAWPNVGAPYILDLESKAWTTGSTTNAPDFAGNSGGTFGRWRYVAAYNVFVLVNSTTENVYFYKHSAGCGPN